MTGIHIPPPGNPLYPLPPVRQTMTKAISTPQELLASWRRRADVLSAAGRREAAEELQRATAELTAFIDTLTARLVRPKDAAKE